MRPQGSFWRSFDWVLFFTVGALIIMGLFMIAQRDVWRD